MNIERLKQLEKFLENDPDDPFLIYAIAIEWQVENPVKTLEYFDILLKNHALRHYLHSFDEVTKQQELHLNHHQVYLLEIASFIILCR